MIKSLLFKEWLKTKWTFISLSGISILAILYIFLDISHGFELSGASAFWEYAIYKKYPLGYDLLYLPLIIGIVMAIVQFYPEINNGRLKLTLHLPVKENKILLSMVILIAFMLAALFIFNLLLFAFLSNIYFPVEVTITNIILLIPCYIAGLLGYFATATVMVEPVWNRRIPQIIFFGGFISFLLNVYSFTSGLLLFFIIITMLSTLAILLSGYYYKRGIK